MSSHKNLVFFNKEGDYLNFNYNDNSDRFEGDILFHENSSDTYKTAGIYMLEKIDSFEYERPEELALNKFQLFNEYGLHFYGAKYASQSIGKIEPVNNDPNFYSKWIYGISFESKFPVGSIIKFDSPFLEFTDTTKTYCVVNSKKDAIMIISEIDNASFESLYYSIYSDVDWRVDAVTSTTYQGKTITGLNLVGVYNYIDNSYNNNLSSWSEPDFYDKYHVGKKLNIVGSELNDTILTVKSVDVTDQIHFEYFTTPSSLPVGTDLVIEVLTKMDLPKVYDGSVNITSDNKVQFTTSALFPKILKPGIEFKIQGSVNNDIFLTVSGVPDFDGITTTRFYDLGSQVYYNNILFECVQAYTHSYGSASTRNITPLNGDYWGSPTYVSVDQSTVAETVLNAGVYLTTDKYYFYYGYTYSGSVTMASAAEKYKTDLLPFNIDLFFKDGKLKADLKYPSKYAEVNFYHTQKGSTYSIGASYQTNERLVEVRESINYELNYNYSENFKFNIVFTDIDEYGIKLVIDKQVYEEEVAFIYTGLVIDMPRTIDRTLRNWLQRNFIRLYVLGIEAELAYIGNFYSPFYNAIKLKTTYPNVPVNLNSVLVGSTADYHIEHSRVLFTDLGPYLNININGQDYGVSAIWGTGGTGSTPDIPATITKWVSEYSELLLEYQFVITNVNNLLKFDIKELDRRLSYTISTGKLNIPGLYDYTITNKLPGNFGMLISSNEITLNGIGDSSFEADGFATGMVVTINNTVYPYDNQNYNIQFLDPLVIDLSYEGPFWGTGDAICNSSAYVTLAFNNGFGQTGCEPLVGPSSSLGGPYSNVMFSDLMFSINNYNTNSYTINYHEYPGATNLIDILYVQLSNSIFLFGDNVVSVDSYTSEHISTLYLTGNTQSVEIEFNTVNGYLYCLSKQQINVVNPLTNTLVGNISLTASNPTASAFDMAINPVNGDIYVTYENWPRVDIFSYNNFSSTPTAFLSSFPLTTTRTGALVFNEFEGDMYFTTDGNQVYRVNSDRTIQTTYGISGITHSIFYEPVYESIYVYATSSLWKIDNGVTQSVTSITSNSFNDVIFNNLTGDMNISDASSQFSRLDLTTNTAAQTSVANYGYIVLNQFDGDVYLSSLNFNNLIVVRPTNGTVVYTAPMSAPTTRLVYNPDRKSVVALQPSLNRTVELVVDLNAIINIIPGTYSRYDENQYGTLSPDYVPRKNIWLKTDEYLRRPRENFEGETSVKYYYKWISDNIPQFFLYDISGSQLPTTGNYAYTGPKPLENPVLNKLPNKDVERNSSPEYQQTVFDKIEYTLSYIDDEDDVTTEVTPMECFIGFKSDEEGALRSILQLYKKEDVEVGYTASLTTYIKIETIDPDNVEGNKAALLTLSSDSETFTNKGLKSGQWIVMYNKDITNTKNQYISENNGVFAKVKEIYTSYIVLDFFDIENDFLSTEKTVIENYPKVGQTTYLKTTIKVVDKEIGRFFTYGQTEIEDPRFKIELTNVGKNLAPNEIFIFKDYDIFEGATDWSFLNLKRKEMLMMKHLIYPYIGAYKSLINAINYFGYNDLQLNEYYRDINTTSPNFGKLFKVEIPDIFDNTVEGWKETDFVKGFSEDNYQVTNLFNLTYFITDKDGENILNYSIDEVIVKLQGLKYWLKRNIIPITHKILDITGRSYTRGGNYITHRVQEIRSINTKDNMSPITCRLNEAYLMPVNSGSTVYNCVIDFYSIVPITRTTVSTASVFRTGNDEVIGDLTTTKQVTIDTVYNSPYTDKVPLPTNYFDVEYPDYFNLKVRTYKTYPEWNPFAIYDFGDKVTYYGNVYQSATSSNKLKNPRKYDDVETWIDTLRYDVSDVIQYNGEVYVFSGLGATYSATQSAPTPFSDTSNWVKITEWKKINLEPVQYITEYRSGKDLKPFNFTVDSNIDPFVVVELTTDNGYGCNYTVRKNYEIRGLKDITQNLKPIDPIGPFQPISPVY